MKLLLAVFAVLISSANSFAYESLNVRGGWHLHQRVEIYCTSENGTNLLMNDRGQVLKTFTFATDCDRAVMSRQGDMVCAENVADKTEMINVRFAIPVKQFIFKSDCMSALDEQINGFTCASDNANGVDLMNLRRVQPIYHFTFKSDCQASLPEGPSGLICVKNVTDVALISSSGQEIQKFNFVSDCEKTRENLLHQRQH
jgi:hypothetical protein